MTARLAEVVDQRMTFRLGHVKLFGKTCHAEELCRTPVDELLCQPDLIAGDFPAADFAGVRGRHGDQILTTFARKILQPYASTVGL